MDKRIKGIIIFLLLLSAVFLVMLVMALMLFSYKSNSDNEFNPFKLGDESGENSVQVVQKPKTMIETIEFYGGTIESVDTNVIYCDLHKALFDENGKSNENFFVNLTDDLEEYFPKKTFYVLDNTNRTKLSKKYDEDKDEYVLLINGLENYYEEVDGEKFAKVDTVKNVIKHQFGLTNKILNKLTINNFYVRHIEEDLGEGEDLGNGYTSYRDGKVKIRIVPTKAVKNIVFSEEYEGVITKNIDCKMPLRKIVEVETDPPFGSVAEGCIGYRLKDYYMFFYKDEVSVYTYSYKYNSTFETALKKYINARNEEIEKGRDNNSLRNFVNEIKSNWQVYDIFDYDEENGNARILVSSRGVDIDIKGNDPKGITLYQNYYFSKYTKDLIKSGVISFEPDKDLLYETEKARRNDSDYFKK